MRWRLSARSEADAYRQATLASESGAQIFLSRLDKIGRKTFLEAVKKALQGGFEHFRPQAAKTTRAS